MMRFAYADPPYPGMAHYYDRDHDVNHRVLIGHLCAEYDGWALSTASTTLQEVLPLCPPDVRVAAWVKPFASFKPGVNPAYAWEPVLFRGSRKRERAELTVRDWCAVNITLRRGFVGAKPAEFAVWVFNLLGVRPGIDEFVDLFPGSGAIGRAWAEYRDTLFNGPQPEPARQLELEAV